MVTTLRVMISATVSAPTGCKLTLAEDCVEQAHPVRAVAPRLAADESPSLRIPISLPPSSTTAARSPVAHHKGAPLP